METSISEDLEDGIVPINISSGEEDIPLPIVQVLLKLNEDPLDLDIKVIFPSHAMDVVPKERSTKKREVLWKL
uniref:Uncharacterized protein n=1 Tax=Cucumis melo TaxID=3656 RepID=A0A9I9DZ14_CUCME